MLVDFFFLVQDYEKAFSCIKYSTLIGLETYQDLTTVYISSENK